MELARLAALLAPFVAGLSDEQLAAVDAYLDLLLRWNARLNLTSVREPDKIVTRHMGESFFAAAHVLPDRGESLRIRVVDVGSGAGFPGLPLKIYAPAVRLALIESQHKKAAFLREAIRTLGLAEAEVFAGRAEALVPSREEPAPTADLVTLRAVERFERVLPVAAALLKRGDAARSVTPRLALLIGAAQAERARQLLPALNWGAPVLIPQSTARVLLVGSG